MKRPISSQVPWICSGDKWPTVCVCLKWIPISHHQALLKVLGVLCAKLYQPLFAPLSIRHRCLRHADMQQIPREQTCPRLTMCSRMCSQSQVIRWTRYLVWVMFFLFRPHGNHLCILWPHFMPGTSNILTTAVQGSTNSEKSWVRCVMSYINVIISQVAILSLHISCTFLMISGWWELILSSPPVYQRTAVKVDGFPWVWLIPLLVALPASLISTAGHFGKQLWCHSPIGSGCPSQK